MIKPNAKTIIIIGNRNCHIERPLTRTIINSEFLARRKNVPNEPNKIIKGSTSNNISGSFNKANLEANKKSPSPTFEILLANSAESINKTTNVDIANETANDIKNFLEKYRDNVFVNFTN
jgi:hypothetical protein